MMIMLVTDAQIHAMAAEPNADNIRELLRAAAWEWYEANKETVVLKRMLNMITIRVRDLRALFVLLFGSPTAQT